MVTPRISVTFRSLGDEFRLGPFCLAWAPSSPWVAWNSGPNALTAAAVFSRLRRLSPVCFFERIFNPPLVWLQVRQIQCMQPAAEVPARSAGCPKRGIAAGIAKLYCNLARLYGRANDMQTPEWNRRRFFRTLAGAGGPPSEGEGGCEGR